jgi:hypothetical protein
MTSLQQSFFLMDQYDEQQFINVGSGDEISILNLAQLIERNCWL